MASDPKGFFDSEVVNAYLVEKGGSYENHEIDYWYAPETLKTLTSQKATVPKDGNAGNQSLPADQYLCMDVGLWAGNGPKDEKNHQRHRDFGVVYGNVAVLCSFPGEAHKGSVEFEDKGSALKSTGGLKTYKEVIEPFLLHLASDAKLGNVKVESALAVGQALPGEETIRVFLGDLHLPIMTDPKNKGLGAKEGSRWVPRAGRLDLGSRIKDRVRKVVSTEAKTFNERWWVPPPISSSLATAAVSYALGSEVWETFKDERIEGWDPRETDGLVSEREASEWTDYYVGRNGNKGAEIFQNAGADLVLFLKKLQEWKGRNGKKLHLVQTGDFLDFWIGLKCGFENSTGGDVNAPISLNSGAEAFANFWFAQTVNNDRAGKVVRELQAMLSVHDPNLKVTILHGNHDNYLSRVRCLPTQAQYEPKRSVVIAEHGHQSDGFNSNQDAQSGWAITQLAFLWPLVRKFEDPASSTITFEKRALLPWATDPGARLQRIARATDLCRIKGRSIYVLGHTHQAMLRKVNVRVKLKPTDVCESGYQCEIALAYWTISYAKEVKDAYQKWLTDEGNRLLDAAAAFKKKKIEEARREIARTKQELEDLKVAANDYAQARIRDAERKLDEAERGLDRLVNVTDAFARKKVEEAHQKILEAEQEMEQLAAACEAVIRMKVLDAKRRIGEAAAALNRLEERSLEWGRVKVKETLQMLEEEMKKAEAAMRATRQQLTETKNATLKWGINGLQDLAQKAAEADAQLRAMLKHYLS